MTTTTTFGHDRDDLIAWCIERLLIDYPDLRDDQLADITWDDDAIVETLVEAVDKCELPNRLKIAAWHAIQIDSSDWWERGNEDARAEIMFDQNCRHCGGTGTILNIDWVPYGNGDTLMRTYELCDCYSDKYDTELA